MFASDRVPESDVNCRLVLACARTGPGEPCHNSLTEILRSTAIDWKAAEAAAERNGLASLFYRAMKHAPVALVPAGVLRSHAPKLRAQAARNLALASELIHITDVLAAREIRALPFKGPLLAAAFYGSPCLREFVDLDILIHRCDAALAESLLLSLGYSREVAFKGYAASHRNGAHLGLRSPRGRIPVELQWDIGLRWELTRASSCQPFDFELLWRNRRTEILCGRSIASLPPEELLIVLSVHGARHYWDRLVWVSDVARLVQKHPDLDWSRVLRIAEQFNCRRRLGLALILAADLLAVNIPWPIRDAAVSDPALPAISTNLGRRLFAPAGSAEPPGRHAPRQAECMRDLCQLAYFTSIHEHWLDRWRLWLRFLRARVKPNSADRELLALPPWLKPLHYVLRPIRLLCVYRVTPALLLLKLLRARASWPAGAE